MRRIMIISLVGLLTLAAAAPVAAGPNVGNYSESMVIAQANWSSGTNDGYTSGYLAASEHDGEGVYLEFGEQVETGIQCTGADTPDDDSDDSFGVAGSYAWGWGSGTLQVGRGYSAAAASGVVDVYTESFDSCTGASDFTTASNVAVTFDLVGDGDLIRESGRGAFQIPGDVNSFDSYRSTYRAGQGTAAIGDRELEVFGLIGKVSWRSHSNG